MRFGYRNPVGVFHGTQQLVDLGPFVGSEDGRTTPNGQRFFQGCGDRRPIVERITDLREVEQ
jgi:hypothetical protein